MKVIRTICSLVAVIASGATISPMAFDNPQGVSIKAGLESSALNCCAGPACDPVAGCTAGQ